MILLSFSQGMASGSAMLVLGDYWGQKGSDPEGGAMTYNVPVKVTGFEGWQNR